MIKQGMSAGSEKPPKYLTSTYQFLNGTEQNIWSQEQSKNNLPGGMTSNCKMKHFMTVKDTLQDDNYDNLHKLIVV